MPVLRRGFSRAREIGTESSEGSFAILFTATLPVLAKHSKSLNLLDSIVGVDRMQRNFGPMRARHWHCQRELPAAARKSELPLSRFPPPLARACNRAGP